MEIEVRDPAYRVEVDDADVIAVREETDLLYIAEAAGEGETTVRLMGPDGEVRSSLVRVATPDSATFRVMRSDGPLLKDRLELPEGEATLIAGGSMRVIVDFRRDDERLWSRGLLEAQGEASVVAREDAQDALLIGPLVAGRYAIAVLHGGIPLGELTVDVVPEAAQLELTEMQSIGTTPRWVVATATNESGEPVLGIHDRLRWRFGEGESDIQARGLRFAPGTQTLTIRAALGEAEAEIRIDVEAETFPQRADAFF